MNNLSPDELERRKKINKKIISFGCLPILGLILIAFIFSTLSNSSNDKEVENNLPKSNDVELNSSTKKTDLNTFDYNLPNSSYNFIVKISDINTTEKKNHFQIKKDDYSIPKNVDGYLLSMEIEITNPYEKEMMAPIPHYFEITSLGGEKFTEKTTYSRSCRCQIDNTSEITDINGKNLWEISKDKCGNNDYCLKFNAKESKKFIITFTEPIISTTKKIVFIGFDKTWDNEGSKRDLGFVIDTEKGEIIDIKKL